MILICAARSSSTIAPVKNLNFHWRAQPGLFRCEPNLLGRGNERPQRILLIFLNCLIEISWHCVTACSCGTHRPHLRTFNTVRRSQWRALTPLLYLSIKETQGMTASVVISHFYQLGFCVSVTPAVCSAG